MGRPRKNYKCPKCKQPGYLEKKPLRVVHYNSLTKKREKPCYVAEIIRNQEYMTWMFSLKKIFEEMTPIELQDYSTNLKEIFQNDKKKAIEAEEILQCVAIHRKIQLPKYKKESAEVPPEHLQWESELYHKIGDLSEHFFKIGRKLKKIQRDVYQFKPDEKISSECVEDLNEFETKLLIPLEKLLVPYDKRWSTNWTGWIKIQLDNLSFGPNHTAKVHAKHTGEYGIYTNKEGQNTRVRILRPMTAKQIKKKEKEVLEFAKQITQANYIEKALTKYYGNASINEHEDEYDSEGNQIINTEDGGQYIQSSDGTIKLIEKGKNSHSDT